MTTTGKLRAQLKNSQFNHEATLTAWLIEKTESLIFPVHW
jgi:hypothetical protein